MPHFEHQGVHFIQLKGSPTERAHQHGLLLKKQIAQGVVPIIAQRNQWMIKRGPGLVRFPAVHRPFILFYEKIFINWLKRHLPKKQIELLEALGESSGLSATPFYHGLFQPDGLLLLARFSTMKYLLKQYPNPRSFGCSSAIVPPSWATHGRLLHSRNMDYPIVGPWEPYTTVAFHEPEGTNEIPHVAISSAGVHTAGLTSVNREGLTLAMHAHFSRRFSLNGVPGTVIGDEIISHAHNLNEAIDIAKKMKPTTNWAFAVSSAKEKSGIILEISPDQVQVRHADDLPLTHTNFFQNRELFEDEALICGAEAEDLENRLCRMRETLAPLKGQITPELLCSLMGNAVDPSSGIERVLGNTLSVITTVKSVVMEPESQTLWISKRKESPTGLGPYLKVKLDGFWNKPSIEGEVPGYSPQDARLVPALQEYRKAYRAWHIENHKPDFENTAYTHARRAAELYPLDGHLWVVAGILAFKTQNFNDALTLFEKAQPLKISNHLQSLCWLFTARCYDLSDRRNEAKALYGQWKKAEEPRIRKALKKGLFRKYNAHKTHEMGLDLQFPDALQY